MVGFEEMSCSMNEHGLINLKEKQQVEKEGAASRSKKRKRPQPNGHTSQEIDTLTDHRAASAMTQISRSPSKKPTKTQECRTDEQQALSGSEHIATRPPANSCRRRGVDGSLASSCRKKQKYSDTVPTALNDYGNGKLRSISPSSDQQESQEHEKAAKASAKPHKPRVLCEFCNKLKRVSKMKRHLRKSKACPGSKRNRRGEANGKVRGSLTANDSQQKDVKETVDPEDNSAQGIKETVQNGSSNTLCATKLHACNSAKSVKQPKTPTPKRTHSKFSPYFNLKSDSWKQTSRRLFPSPLKNTDHQRPKVVIPETPAHSPEKHSVFVEDELEYAVRTENNSPVATSIDTKVFSNADLDVSPNTALFSNQWPANGQIVNSTEEHTDVHVGMDDLMPDGESAMVDLAMKESEVIFPDSGCSGLGSPKLASTTSLSKSPALALDLAATVLPGSDESTDSKQDEHVPPYGTSDVHEQSSNYKPIDKINPSTTDHTSSTAPPHLPPPASKYFKRTLTSPSKKTAKISPYFPQPAPPPAKPKYKAGDPVVPLAPLSSPYFGLFQEVVATSPWALIIGCIFVTMTRASLALPEFWRFLTRYPTPDAVAAAYRPDIVSIFAKLGLQERRTTEIIEISRAWITEPPRKGRRFRTENYPTRGAHKEIHKEEGPLADEVEDARVAAFEIGHLKGVGRYILDSWRIFCRDTLREVDTSAPGFVPEWMRVLPEDKELREYVRWLKEGWEWNTRTGERDAASVELQREALERKRVVVGETEWLGVWWEVKDEEEERLRSEAAAAAAPEAS